MTHELNEYASNGMEQHAPKVIEMYWSGVQFGDIAKEIGVSEWFVRKILQTSGGKVPRRNFVSKSFQEREPERYERISKLVEQGLSSAQIAEITGANYKTVKKHFPQVVDGRVQKNLQPELLKKVEERVRQGIHAAEIEKELGVSKQTIKKHFPEYNQHKQSGITTELYDSIALMVEDETPIAEISRTLNVAQSTIKKYFPEAGIGKQNGPSVSAMLKRAEQVYKEWGV